MVLCKIGIVESRNAADHVIAGILDLLHRLAVFFQVVPRRSIGSGGVLLHSGRSIAHSAAVLNVDHEGIDAAAGSNIQIGVHIRNKFVVQVQRLHFFGHHVVRKGHFLSGEVVQTGRIAAAPAVTAGSMKLILGLVVLLDGFLLRAAHIAGADIAGGHRTVSRGGADDVTGHSAVFIQALKAHHRQLLALIHQFAQYCTGLIQ